jgi:uncharacterized protein
LANRNDPGKVTGFLDLAGAWDPSLALMVAGAIAVGFFAFATARKRTTSYLGGAMHLPPSDDIDSRVLSAAWCSEWAGDWWVFVRDRR